MVLEHQCSSVYCELHSLSDDDEVTIEFTDVNGNTVETQVVNPRIAEELLYDWCLQNLQN